ncbi:MAG: ATP synthase F1 subunit delta [Planctomycetes bacterium]|nr:ATP synthase F1 subunit delta [Planctomycetota bacterium]
MATNQSSPVARMYATALYEAASEAGNIGEVHQGLQVINDAWQDKGFRDYFTSPRIPRPIKIKGMDAALAGKIPVQLLNFIKVLIIKGREPVFDNIVSAFEIHRDEAENRVHAWVEGGTDFTATELDELKKQISASHGGSEVVMHFQYNPALLGGARIRVGDKMIDNSLATKLAHLAQAVE